MSFYRMTFCVIENLSQIFTGAASSHHIHILLLPAHVAAGTLGPDMGAGLLLKEREQQPYMVVRFKISAAYTKA